MLLRIGFFHALNMNPDGYPMDYGLWTKAHRKAINLY